MTKMRYLHMYGNQPAIHTVSWTILCLGLGCLATSYESLGKIGLIVNLGALLYGVHIVESLIKSVVFLRENFSVSIKVNSR